MIHVLQKMQSIAIQHGSLCYAQKHSSNLQKECNCLKVEEIS